MVFRVASDYQRDNTMATSTSATGEPNAKRARVDGGVQLTLRVSSIGKLSIVGSNNISVTVNAGAGVSASAGAGVPAAAGAGVPAASPRAGGGAAAAAGKRLREGGAVSDSDNDEGGGSESGSDDSDADDSDVEIIEVAPPEGETKEERAARIERELDAMLEKLPLRAKRRSYSLAQQNMMLRILDKVDGQVATAMKRINKKRGYESVDRKMLRNWRDARLKPVRKNKRGKKVNEAFEKAVLSNFVFSVLEKVDGDDAATVKESVRVVANVAHSYEAITAAALLARAQLPWRLDPKLQKRTKLANGKTIGCDFSRGWVQKFLKRHRLRRRRITAAVKVLPAESIVRARMKELQHILQEGGYELSEIHSADETAIFHGATPKNQYVTRDADRATAPESDDKARFTAVMWGAADGTIRPPFIIIKCTVNRADMRGVKVIADLKKDATFAGDEWQLQEWSRTLTLNIKSKSVTLTYHRPYLINTVTKAVITAQHRAWMDSVGMCMWADVQVRHFAVARPVIVIWDNCGPHNVAAVKAVFAENNIATESLPPKMTDILQVMDLVVNSVLKAGIRRQRTIDLFMFFQSWKLKWAQQLALPAEERKMPVFNPPKSKVTDGIRTLLRTIDRHLKTEAFKNSMRRTFIKVGLAPAENGSYYTYTGHSNHGGTLPSMMMEDAPDSSAFTLPDLVAEVDVEVRPEDHEEDDGDLEDMPVA